MPLEKVYGHHGSSAIHRVESHTETARTNSPGIYMLQHTLDVQGRRPVGLCDDALNIFIGRLAELALMVKVDQFVSLVVVEEEARTVEEFQRVVLRRIVRGGDSDSAKRMRRWYVHLNRWSGQHSNVHHFTARGEEAAMNRMLEHGAARARVAPHDNTALAHICSKSLSELARQARRKETSDNSADPGNPDFQKMLAPLRHARFLTSSTSAW
jgi:hypothetical protein